MTTSHERTRSAIQTRMLLEALCATARTAGIPEEIRREALRLLRHYPDGGHLDRAAIAWPEIWAPIRLRQSDTPSYVELIVRLRELTRNSLGGAQGLEPGSVVPRLENT
jgi:hypothetical protein